MSGFISVLTEIYLELNLVTGRWPCNNNDTLEIDCSLAKSTSSNLGVSHLILDGNHNKHEKLLGILTAVIFLSIKMTISLIMGGGGGVEWGYLDIWFFRGSNIPPPPGHPNYVSDFELLWVSCELGIKDNFLSYINYT